MSDSENWRKWTWEIIRAEIGAGRLNRPDVLEHGRKLTKVQNRLLARYVLFKEMEQRGNPHMNRAESLALALRMNNSISIVVRQFINGTDPS